MNMSVLKFRLNCYSAMLQYIINNINSEQMTSVNGYCAVPLKIPQIILEQYYIKVIMLLHSTINRSAWELVSSRVSGGPTEVQGKARMFHGNPASGNQPWRRPPASTVTPKELQRGY